MPESGDFEVDARGLKCPLPALMTARAARGRPSGARLRLLATDRASAIDIRHLCAERGYTLESVVESDGLFTYLIRLPLV